MSDIRTPDSRGNVLERLLDRIEMWARQAGSAREIERMSAAEFHLLAADVGLNEGDLSRLARMEVDASRLLYKRLAGLGLTMEQIEAKGVGLRHDMERTCGLCADRGLCAHDLAERPDAQDWRKVCPNSWTFDEMERQAAKESAMAVAGK